MRIKTIIIVLTVITLFIVSCGTNRYARKGCRSTWGMSGY